MLAVRNALKKLQQAGDECHEMAEYLQGRLEDIQQHSRRA
jgi:hypothetical protein